MNREPSRHWIQMQLLLSGSPPQGNEDKWQGLLRFPQPKRVHLTLLFSLVTSLYKNMSMASHYQMSMDKQIELPQH